MKFGWYYIRDSFGATHDDVWSAVEEAITKGAERGRLADVRVGEMRRIDFDELLSVEDVVEHIEEDIANGDATTAEHLLASVHEQIQDLVFEGRAFFKCSDQEADAAIVAFFAKHCTFEVWGLARAIHAWFKANVALEPETVCDGWGPLPIELVDGKWRCGERGADYGREAEAVITYATEPSPETGHVGWVWWAQGKMGDAESLQAAREAAEAALNLKKGRPA